MHRGEAVEGRQSAEIYNWNTQTSKVGGLKDLVRVLAILSKVHQQQPQQLVKQQYSEEVHASQSLVQQYTHTNEHSFFRV